MMYIRMYYFQSSCNRPARIVLSAVGFNDNGEDADNNQRYSQVFNEAIDHRCCGFYMRARAHIIIKMSCTSAYRVSRLNILAHKGNHTPTTATRKHYHQVPSKDRLVVMTWTYTSSTYLEVTIVQLVRPSYAGSHPNTRTDSCFLTCTSKSG